MISTFRSQEFGIFFSITISLCVGQLDISAGPLIHGRPAVLFCSIPSFSEAGFWNKDGFVATQCRAGSGCFPQTEGELYSYSSNTSGLFLTITGISRDEERTWICGHTGDEDVTYDITYNNVFVIPTLEEVYGVESNVTLGNDIPIVTLTFTTTCMHPQPNIHLFYTDEGANVTLKTNLDSINTTDSVCLSPEAAHVGSITVSSNDLCGVSIRPKLFVTPDGLPFEYSTATWESSHYIQFPECQVLRGLTTDEAFGYSALFSVVGMLMGVIFTFGIYRLLVFTGKISFVILDATDSMQVKMKLYFVSAIITLLVCMVIAAVVVIVECGTECTDFTVGTSAAFIISGIVIQLLFIWLVVYLFVRCCQKGKDGVKKMEEDHIQDNISFHGSKSGRVTVTPSAIDVGTPGNYSRNQAYVENDHMLGSSEFRKTRKFSENSYTSIDLKTDRSYIKTSNEVQKNKSNLGRSEDNDNLRTDRTHIDNSKKIVQQQNDSLNVDSSSAASSKASTFREAVNKKNEFKSKNQADSSRSTTSVNSNKVVPYSDKVTDGPVHTSEQFIPEKLTETASKSHDQQNHEDSETSDESNDERVIDKVENVNEQQIWSISRRDLDSDGRLVSSATNNHVMDYTGNNQSKVMVTSDDQSLIISVPTGDDHQDTLSTASSSDDEALQTNAASSDKTSTKKRSKKKKWRKKKNTFVSPEQQEKTNKPKTEKKKSKTKTKAKKKKKIIV